MMSIESDCIDCDLPCIYSACKHYKVERYYCDECESETQLYIFDGEELCSDCIINRLEKVEGSFDY